MSKLVRFDPFAEIDALQKQFFDDDWLTPMRGVHMPTTDVYTDDNNEMVVEAQLPNFSDKDIQVSLDDDYLVIRADRHEKEADASKKYVVRESSSSLYRRIYLPERVNRDAVRAKFDSGVLKVAVPFKDLVPPKKIVVTSKARKSVKP